MSAVLKIEVRFTTLTCITCGMQFAPPSDFVHWRRLDGQWFYCPSGHAQSYTPGKTEAEQLREHLAAKERELESERSRTAFFKMQSEGREKSLRATRGQLTRTKNRIAKGVCPCCRRSFVNLQRHMQGQHPSFAESANAGDR